MKVKYVMSEHNEQYNFEGHAAVERAVRDFSRRRRGWRFAREMGLCIGVSLAALLAWSVADWAVKLPAAAVLGGLLLAVLVVLAGLATWAVAVLRRAECLNWEAINIEKLHGGFDNALIGTLQLVDDARRSAGMYSASLIGALASSTARRLQDEHLPRLIDRRSPARIMAATGFLAAAALTLLLFADGFVAGRLASVRGSYHTLIEQIWPVRLVAGPGDKTLLRGEDGVLLAVEMTGGQYQSLRLVAQDDEGTKIADELLAVSRAGRIGKAQKALAADQLANVRKHFTYRFETARHQSKTHTIRVVDRPRIENLSAELTFPSYTQMMPQQLAGMFTSIRALRETTVVLSLAANKPLQRATLVFGGGAAAQGPGSDAANAQPLDVTGRFASTQFAVQAGVEAELQLECEDGFTTKLPYRFKIEPIDDNPPEIEILMKKEELLLLKDEAESLTSRVRPCPWPAARSPAA